MQLLSESTQTARKNYYCEGFEQIDRTLGMGEANLLTEGENIKIHGINRGEKYIKQNWKDGSTLYSFRTCKRCLDIINELELYEE